MVSSNDDTLNESKTSSTGSNRLLQLPVARVKTIMKSSPDLGNVSQEAYFLITRATECFVQHMAKQAYKSSGDSDTVQYKHLANIVESNDNLEFLEEIIPQKITVKEYWNIIGYNPNTTKKTPQKQTSKQLDPIVID